MSIIKEFKEFAVKGNALDMAVGIIIGGAFGGVVSSLVKDVIMPPIGLALGNVDFKDLYLVPGRCHSQSPCLTAQKRVGHEFGVF